MIPFRVGKVSTPKTAKYLGERDEYRTVEVKKERFESRYSAEFDGEDHSSCLALNPISSGIGTFSPPASAEALPALVS